MKIGTPFRRARIMLAAMAAAIRQFGHQPIALEQAIGAIAPYKANRKSSGAQHRSRNTTAQFKRAALKKRNRRRNKLAQKG